MPEDEVDENDDNDQVDNNENNGETDDKSGARRKPAEDDDDRKVRLARKDRDRTARELEATKRELAELKNKDLPEAEKLRSERDELREKVTNLDSALRKANLRSVALEEATELGFRSPALAFRLLDNSDVEWDDDKGEPTNVRELLRDVLKQEPALKGRRRRERDENDDDDDEDEDADGGKGRSGGKANGAGDMNRRLREAVGR